MSPVVSPIDGEKFARVNRVWQSETAVIIGGGPSLTQAQVDACRGLKCIAVNDAYLLAPWADAVYFADSKWWAWHKDRPEFKAFSGLKVSIENAMPQVPAGAAFFLKNWASIGKHGMGLSPDPAYIGTGCNSAFQALNIAVLAGAARVILLGVDGKAASKTHWFGDHPDKTGPPYAQMKTAFKVAAEECRRLGVDLVNCSPGTAIDHCRLARLEDELARVVPAETAALVSG